MLRSELAGAVVADAGRPMWFGWRGRGMIASSPRLNKLPHSTLFTMRPPSSLSLFFSPSFHPQKSGGRETKRPILSSLFVLFSLQPFRFLSLYLFSFRDIDNPEGVKITGDPSIPYKWGLIIDKVGNERKQFARSEDGEDRKLLAAG